MRTKIFTGAILLLISTSISAQFVGDGSTPQAATTPAKPMKGTFTLKFGAAVPVSNFGITPKRVSLPQYSSGVMGAKTGFFAEMGFGMSLSNPDKMVGFYYYPIMAAYWQTSIDWNKLGGFFTDKTIYTKPVSAMDIGQRYGIVVKPIKDLSVALYYRPGLIIPFNFEVSHDNLAQGEKFRFTGTMATGKSAPVFMMSHTPGLSVRYKMASISFEGYFTRPTYEVHYQDIDINPLMAVDLSTTGKIPVKMFLISLALNL